MADVLVVDDDRAVREALVRALALDGHQVRQAADGLEAVNAVATTVPDVVILDVNMPGVDGFGVAERLRGDGFDVPILMLTARDDVADRVAGLDSGADDYLIKPFALDELRARLRALLRRTTSADGGVATHVLRFADLVLDTRAVTVHRGAREIELTRTEFDLLHVFMAEPKRVLSRDVLHTRVWGQDMSASNTAEVYVGYVRKKLEADGEPRLIHTVRGFGYVLKESAPA